MRATFRWLANVLFVAVVIQVGLAAYGAFNAIHKAEHVRITKKTIENGFDPHGIVGTLILVVMLALVIVALAGRLGPFSVRLAGIAFGLGILQLILGIVSTSAPAVGFLHGVNALAIFAVTGLLAHRTSAAERAASPAPVAPAPSSP